LLSVAAGGLTARHEHSGAEFCTVLKGAYRDELGVFAAGDFAAAESDLNHQPVVHGEETCVCLFATEGRLKAHGLLGRLAFAYAGV
jgi:putative transcriptional regulator